MRYLFTNDKETPIDELITTILDQMHTTPVLSDEYSKLMGILERLNELKSHERKEPVDRNTIALIAGNLMGILIIVAYEQKHVVTSKGLNQLIRPKSG